MSETVLIPPSDTWALKISYPILIIGFGIIAVGFDPLAGIAKVVVTVVFVGALIQHSLSKSSAAQAHYLQIAYVFAIGLVAAFGVGALFSVFEFIALFAAYEPPNLRSITWTLGFLICLWQVYKMVQGYLCFRGARVLPSFHLI